MATIANAVFQLTCRAALLAVCTAATAQVELTTERASERRGGDFAPAMQGQTVKVEGRVVARAIHVLDLYAHLGIEQNGHGLMLECPGGDPTLDQLSPGEDVEAVGRISTRGGMVVLIPSQVRVLGRGQPPSPVPVPIEELQGVQHLGRLVVTEGRVIEIGENTGGEYMLLGNSRNPYKLFVPMPMSHHDSALAGFAPGDKVRAVGIASQYCPTPPFDRWFELMLAHPGNVVRIGGGLPISPRMLIFLVLSSAMLAFGLVRRERRLRGQREMLRRAYQLGEEILGSSSTPEVASGMARVLPEIFRVSRVYLYLHNKATKTLDKVSTSPEEAPVSIPLAAPFGVEAGVVACFQNRRLLAVPDMSRSPFSALGQTPGSLPRSSMFVPMIAQGETVGAFELDQDDRFRIFSPDEQALAQHLGNQIGVALKLLDQRSVREQLFRTEKLAAVGKLVSGVVNELQVPLSSIRNLANHALSADRHGSPVEHTTDDLQAISQAASKAAGIVTRLVAFAGAEQMEARPVDLNRLVQSLAEFREQEWKSRGIRVRALLCDEPLTLVASQGQLEQVLLALMVHAEQSMVDAADKLIDIHTTRLAGHALVEISYSGPRGGPDPFAGSGEGAASTLGLGVCRSIIAGHGGELRAVEPAGANPRFEIQLPLSGRDWQPAQPHLARTRDLSRPLTALVIEPDETAQRHLLTLLSARRYRVIPVQNSDVGLDLAGRLRFEIVFCSVRAPGLNWVELSERIQAHSTAFVLLSDGYDPELAADFEGDGRFVLPKPVDEHHFDHILERVEGPLKSPGSMG